MNPDFKYYQPLVVGDTIEYDGIDYFIIEIGYEENTLKEKEIIIFPKDFNNIATLCRDNDKVIKLITLYSTNITIKNRILSNISDMYCKYTCPLNIKNLASKDLCKYCNLKTNLSPSEIFFLGDEVRCNLIENGKTAKFNAVIRGITFSESIRDVIELIGPDFNFKIQLQNPLKNLYLKLIESTYDEITNIITSGKDELLSKLCYRLFDINTRRYLSFSVSSKNLRLRNRKGFTWDFNKFNCDNSCIFNETDYCNYECSSKSFVNKCNQCLTKFNISYD